MLTSVERHDPLSDSWSARASMPYGLAMHHYGGYPIAEFMGDIYIFVCSQARCRAHARFVLRLLQSC